ncbi:MAG: hypothetical protein ACTSRP_16390 [Candidatus Helarchaeota archaeon]
MNKFKFNNIELPFVMIGTSPFMGAGQFGFRGLEWRAKFMNNANLMSELMIYAYELGAVGIEMLDIGKVADAIDIVCKKYSDYIVLASTHWSNLNIKNLAVRYKSKVIFLHGNISDRRNKDMILSIFEEIRSYNVIPGIATHEPIKTIKFAQDNNLGCEIFLIPFNKIGYMMSIQKKLEDLVDKSEETFIAMKPLAAGRIKPQEAFEYLIKHNISGAAVGLVSKEEIQETVPIAVKLFNNKHKS